MVMEMCFQNKVEKGFENRDEREVCGGGLIF